jgi:hypothetical protein
MLESLPKGASPMQPNIQPKILWMGFLISSSMACIVPYSSESVIQSETTTSIATATSHIPLESPATAPADIPTPTLSAKPTTPPQPTATPTPTVVETVPTVTSSPTPAATLTIPVQPTVTLAATESSHPDSLAINSFTVEVEDFSDNGKRLTFAWNITGATRATISVGNTDRFFPVVPIDTDVGTMTLELHGTKYPNPAATLHIEDAEGHMLDQSITIEWPCSKHEDVLFGGRYCPSTEVRYPQAAQQQFEHGFMIWHAVTQPDETAPGGTIYVFYDDGKCEQFDDTWQANEPEYDPALTPPEGLYQPVRGFGKAWRENEGIREKLGWAVASEQGFTGIWQDASPSSLSATHEYIQTIDGRIIGLSHGPSNWSFWEKN